MMKTFAHVSFVVVSFLAAGCGAPRAEHPEIRAVLERQAEAWNRGDIDGFMEGYWKSPELTFVSVSREPVGDDGKTRDVTSTLRGWQATLERYRRRYPTPERMGRLTFHELEVAHNEPDAAEVSGRYHLDRGDDDASGRFYLHMRRIDAAWVIVRDRTVAD